MDSKSIFASKTLWVNLLGPFFAWLASKGLALTPDQQLAFVGIGMAGVNVLLRLFTKQPVHVVTPPSAVLALIAAGVLAALTACGALTNPDGSPMTTAQAADFTLQVACGAYSSDKAPLEVAISDGLIDQKGADALHKAEVAADAICMGGTPTDLKSAIIAVNNVAVQIVLATAEANRKQAAPAAPAKS